MKCFINFNFWFYIIGNGICGTFYTATEIGAQIIAENWYSFNKKGLVISIIL